MNDVKIDWKKYVDKIYCIKYIGESEYRTNKCKEEFNRVDILDSGIYYEFVNVNSPIYKDIYQTLFTKFSKDRPYDYVTDCTFGHYYCMKHAEYFDYKRILILESDDVFLRDKNQIIEILEKSKEIMDNDENSLMVLNGCEVDCPAYTFTLPKEFYIKFNSQYSLWCAGFNIYSKNAYKLFIDKFEKYEFFTNDTYKFIYGDKINVYNNEVNICIQQDWVKMTTNFDVLYNIDINKDFIDRFKYVRLELFNSWVANFHQFQSFNAYDILKYKPEDNVYHNYLYQLFNTLNTYLFDNKLNINDYIIG